MQIIVLFKEDFGVVNYDLVYTVICLVRQKLSGVLQRLKLKLSSCLKVLRFVSFFFE